MYRICCYCTSSFSGAICNRCNRQRTIEALDVIIGFNHTIFELIREFVFLRTCIGDGREPGIGNSISIVPKESCLYSRRILACPYGFHTLQRMCTPIIWNCQISGGKDDRAL